MGHPAESREKTVFHFAVLVYQEEIAPGRMLWFARSVMTSDLAFGETAEKAIADLHETLEVAMLAATSRGMTPEAWLRTQRPDRPEWIEEWIRRSALRRTAETWPAVEGCEIEASIAWKGAA